MSEPRFEVVGDIPFTELDARLRTVTLLNQSDIRPYEDADISVERFFYEDEDVLPTSKYVLTRQLAVQRAVQVTLLRTVGYDQLDMSAGLILDGGEKGRQGLIPPIVELFEEDDRPTSRIPLVIDGSHRTNMGRFEGRDSFLAIFIRDIRPDCPPYAFPNSWDEVQELAELPEDRATWKNYRGDVTKGEQYKLYRDYSPINGSAPRADNK